MTKSGINLQDSFLNQVRKDSTPIEMVLLDGSRLSGIVRGFDNFTVILQAEGDQHLVYKHAIAQIINQRGALRDLQPQRSEQNRPPRQPRPQQQAQPQGGGQPQQQVQPGAQPQQGGEAARSQAQNKAKFNNIDLSDVKID